MASTQRAAVARGKRFLVGFVLNGTAANRRRLQDATKDQIRELDARPEPVGMWNRIMQNRVEPFAYPMAVSMSALRGYLAQPTGVTADQLELVLAPWREGIAQITAAARRPKMGLVERILRLARWDAADDVARAELLANPRCVTTRMRAVELTEHTAYEALQWCTEERARIAVETRHVA